MITAQTVPLTVIVMLVKVIARNVMAVERLNSLTKNHDPANFAI